MVPSRLVYIAPTSIFATHHLLQHKQYFRILPLPPPFLPHTTSCSTNNTSGSIMLAVTPATVAVAKKRKVKGLPPGLEKLTETCEFWKSLKFQLEIDGKEHWGEHMVAYEAYFEDFPSVQLDKLTLDQLRLLFP
jgi:hypothetical protein